MNIGRKKGWMKRKNERFLCHACSYVGLSKGAGCCGQGSMFVVFVGRVIKNFIDDGCDLPM